MPSDDVPQVVESSAVVIVEGDGELLEGHERHGREGAERPEEVFLVQRCARDADLPDLRHAGLPGRGPRGLRERAAAAPADRARAGPSGRRRAGDASDTPAPRTDRGAVSSSRSSGSPSDESTLTRNWPVSGSAGSSCSQARRSARGPGRRAERGTPRAAGVEQRGDDGHAVLFEEVLRVMDQLLLDRVVDLLTRVEERADNTSFVELIALMSSDTRRAVLSGRGPGRLGRAAPSPRGRGDRPGRRRRWRTGRGPLREGASGRLPAPVVCRGERSRRKSSLWSDGVGAGSGGTAEGVSVGVP